MRIAIVGSGIAGLSTAHLLAQRHVDTVVFEKAGTFGGRANIDQNGEHCPRIFLDDYDSFFALLREIPVAGGETVFGNLRRLRRLVLLRSGWVEVSHLYRAFAREVPVNERIRLARESRRLRLVAEENFGPNTNRYGRRRNFTMPHLLRLVRNLFRSRVGYAFDGPNDVSLLQPWLDHLTRAGVVFRAHTLVGRIEPRPDGVVLHTGDAEELFDAAVVTAYVPDLIDLLDGSALSHTLVMRPDVHCKVMTVTLDPREPILGQPGPAIYCHGGVNVVLQPQHRRCVVLCTWSPSTDDAFVLGRLTEFFGLRYPPVAVGVRDNHGPDEGVYAADPVDPSKILVRSSRAEHIHFAGSYLRTGYPLDSGESAVRSAMQVVARISDQYGLPRRPVTLAAGQP